MRLCTLSRTFVCCCLLAAGCGDSGSGPGDRTEPFKQTPIKQPAESGKDAHRACSLLSSADVARLLRRPGLDLATSANDSTDLSICDWRGGRVRVELVLDTAPRAQLRFYNQLSEQLEYYNQDRLRRPYQLKHVGDDSAYGGAGAWWTRSKGQLIAYADNRILRVRAPSKQDAVRVARGAFRRLSEPAG
jgi:hypothetical protein